MSAKKYKLDKGKRRDLTKEQVLVHKDFGRLMNRYEQATQRLYRRPLYKDPKAFLGLLFVLLLLWLIMMDDKPGEDSDLAPKETTNAPAK